MARHIYWKNLPLGRGAGGTVYKGRSRIEGHERDCAVKVMHPSMADDPVQRSRFSREGIVGYELAGYTNVVGTRTFGASTGGAPCLVMDLEGPTFDRLVPLPRGSFAVVWSVAAGVIRALATLEVHGWVHGDINTGNIFLGRDGSVKLGDFAKSMSPRGPMDADHGTALNRRDDRRGLALVLARLATGAIPKTHEDGMLAPLPDWVPENLGVLIRGLATPQAQGGLGIAEARAYIDQHAALHAMPEDLLELAREVLEDERHGWYDPENDWDDPEYLGEDGDGEQEVDEQEVDEIEEIGEVEPGTWRPDPPAPAQSAALSASVASVGSKAGSGQILALACACVLGAAATAVMFVMHTSRDAGQTWVVTSEPDAKVSTQRSAMPEEYDASRMHRRIPTSRENSQTGASAAGERAEEAQSRSRATWDHAGEEPALSESTTESMRGGVVAETNSLLNSDTIELVGTARMPGVVVSVDQGIRLSHDTAMLRLRVRNHGATQLRIALPRLRDEHERLVPTTLGGVRSMATSGDYWIVPDGVEGRIALVVQDAERLSGQHVTLEIVDPDGDVALAIEDIRWP